MQNSLFVMYSDASSLLNGVMIFIIFFICWVQPSAPRMVAGLSFSIVSMALMILNESLSDYLLYLVSGLAALLVMIIVSAGAQVSSVSLSIHKICLTAIALNCAGYLIYESGASHIIYNVSFNLLYIWTIITLLKKDTRADATGFTRDCWRATFCYSATAWFQYLFKSEEKT